MYPGEGDLQPVMNHVHDKSGNWAGPFHLHQVLVGHTDDVRTLVTSAGGGIVSGSRDKSIRVWRADVSETVSSSSSELKGHGDYVSALALAPIDDSIVSGSRDSSVRVWRKAGENEEYGLATVCIVDDILLLCSRVRTFPLS